jgi:hypothetical protein
MPFHGAMLTFVEDNESEQKGEYGNAHSGHRILLR